MRQKESRRWRKQEDIDQSGVAYEWSRRPEALSWKRAGAVAHGTERRNCGGVAQPALWLPIRHTGRPSSSDATIQTTPDRYLATGVFC